MSGPFDIRGVAFVEGRAVVIVGPDDAQQRHLLNQQQSEVLLAASLEIFNDFLQQELQQARSGLSVYTTAQAEAGVVPTTPLPTKVPESPKEGMEGEQLNLFSSTAPPPSEPEADVAAQSEREEDVERVRSKSYPGDREALRQRAIALARGAKEATEDSVPKPRIKT